MSILWAQFKIIGSRVFCRIINIVDLEEILESFSLNLWFYLYKDTTRGVPEAIRVQAGPCPPALRLGLLPQSIALLKSRELLCGEKLAFSFTCICSFFSSPLSYLPPSVLPPVILLFLLLFLFLLFLSFSSLSTSFSSSPFYSSPYSSFSSSFSVSFFPGVEKLRDWKKYKTKHASLT